MNEKNIPVKYAILPCNGLDKTAGCVAREVALELGEQLGCEIICPVLYQMADAYYVKNTEDNSVLVIDGCQTRCASKLAAKKGLRVTKKIVVTEYAKNQNIKLAESLRLTEVGINLSKILVSELLKVDRVTEQAISKETDFLPKKFIYETYLKDKFIFKLPKDRFLFSENDCWVYISGNIARIGVTDFVQQSLSDIIFFTPPTIGAEVEQFGELGIIESGKAVFELISPISGKIIAINELLINAPELINQNPYEDGWIADVELSNFEEDKKFLLDFTEYFQVLKRKADAFHVK